MNKKCIIIIITAVIIIAGCSSAEIVTRRVYIENEKFKIAICNNNRHLCVNPSGVKVKHFRRIIYPVLKNNISDISGSLFPVIGEITYFYSSAFFSSNSGYNQEVPMSYYVIDGNEYGRIYLDKDYLRIYNKNAYRTFPNKIQATLVGKSRGIKYSLDLYNARKSKHESTIITSMTINNMSGANYNFNSKTDLITLKMGKKHIVNVRTFDYCRHRDYTSVFTIEPNNKKTLFVRFSFKNTDQRLMFQMTHSFLKGYLKSLFAESSVNEVELKKNINKWRKLWNAKVVLKKENKIIHLKLKYILGSKEEKRIIRWNENK